MRPPHAFRPFAVLCLSAFLTLVAACGGKDGGPATPLDPQDPPPPPPTNPDSATSTVSNAGGSVLLPDGSGVVFPAGAVSTSMPVTVRKADPGAWFDADATRSRVVLTTTAPVSEFNGQVEIRVPLPADATLADTSRVVAGVIDEETGAVTVERSTIRMIDGKPYAVVSTNHFTSRVVEWLFGKQPPSSAMLSVPYYNQGSSNYCWAASLHMVTQATDFEQLRAITDIIGKAGIDEEGITSISFRMSSAVASAVRDRTGVRPDRKMWDYVNANLVRDYLWQEIGVNGRPVAVYVGGWEHAVVVVGYDMNTFRIHDPNATSNGAIGYTTKEWKTFVEGMGIKDRIVTLAVPKAVKGGDRVTASFLNEAIQFTKPAFGPEAPAAVYQYAWDYTRPSGYSFRHLTARDVMDPLPGEVDRLQTVAEIQLSNSSRTAARDISVYLDITAMGAPTGVGRLSTHRDVTVGPNSLVNLTVPDILVDTFRFNSKSTVEYVMTVSALTGSTTVDQQSIVFRIDPVRPDLTSVSPSTAAVGDEVTIKGQKLGRIPFNNTVTFNDTKADSIVSWSDSEIKVIVPEDATTGPLVVKRGEVTSDSLDFTVSKLTTLNGTSTQSFNLSGATLTATGPWSLQGVGASLDYYVPDTQHHIYSVKAGETATFSYTFGAVVSPASWKTAQGNTVQFKYVEWTVETQLQPVTGSSPVLEQSGSGGSRTYTFTPLKRGDTFRSHPTVLVYGDLFDSNGKLIVANTKLGEFVVGVFTVEGS